MSPKAFSILESRDHRNDARDVFRAGAPPGLLAATEQSGKNRPRRGALRNPTPRGSSEFMGTCADIVAFAKALSGFFSHPLRGITKERHLASPAQGKNITPWLQERPFRYSQP